MPLFYRDHILVNEHTESLPYTSIIQGRSPVFPRTNLDRIEHGITIREEFNAAVEAFIADAPSDDFIYIVFKSAPGFLLDLEKMNNRNFRLASYRKLNGDPNDEVYEATVLLNQKAIAQFLVKIEQFINEDTKKGNPKHQTLIANLEQIRAATLESFWLEPELPFPDAAEDLWWEIWLSRDLDLQPSDQLNPIFNLLTNGGMQVGMTRWLAFPDNLVFLVRGNSTQLGATILYTDRLTELRKPRETAEYFTFLDKPEQAAWMQDLLDRLDMQLDGSNIAVCLLDTGVNREHPLLAPIIPENNLDAIEPNWNRRDTHHAGHGTPMAGLAIYGDLSEVLPGNLPIQIFHHLASIMIIAASQPNDPLLYGAITQEAIARAEIIHPNFKRLVSMAVTSTEVIHRGRPSSWAAAIDQSLFGDVDEPNENTLLFISAGNLPLLQRQDFPEANHMASIEDPAQAFNAITVGAYTIKDQIDLQLFPGATLVAQHGQMSPSNTTSMTWFREWPRKPDIVMEGGNHGIHQGGLIDPDSLQLLSTGKGGLGRPWFTAFGDTSASTALAAKFAAELYHAYPDYWPETIRGLTIHSADWTNGMLGGHTINDLDANQKISLIATVGYGVPHFGRARYSASNSLSLVIQRTLKPYKYEDNRIKTEDFHMIELPWPSEVLSEMLATQVRLKVTLSYFVEPNPGNKQYDMAASYRSHGLRFKMKDTYEGDDVFAARISKAARTEDDYIAEGGEHWILGNQIRDKGSVHKDIWQGTAAELSTRNKIAVYPVGGWWKFRKILGRYNYSVRYSLIVTVETPDNGIDIYTPVRVLVPIEI
ncbi:MAG: S8 family peptidase [Bacteroidetes bacterium]|nr:S8 family peptidase [Bacteroidota bacterium]